MTSLDQSESNPHNIVSEDGFAMPNQFNKMIFLTTQNFRTAWYSAHYLIANRLTPQMQKRSAGDLPRWSRVLSDLQELRNRDWTNISDGLYPAPKSDENTIGQYANRTFSFFKDLKTVNRRRAIGNMKEIRDPILNDKYPDYYLQNFHYQSGGYLTSESAKLYDHQVEVLFIGGADAMRRQALAETTRYFRKSTTRESNHLDIACGTGRFLAMLKSAYPRLRITGIDLSHPYLCEARTLLQHWSRVRLAQANAESLPFPNETFNSVSCIFLFHELPKAIRRCVVAEIFRVLKPGGRLFFLDSIQIGDRPNYDSLLEHFPVIFHEPYYLDFIRSDLSNLFTGLGLNLLKSEIAFFCKLITLGKP